MIFAGILLNLLIATGVLTGFWLFYLWKRNPAVVDLGWATGLTVMGLTHNLRADMISTGQILVSLLIVLWGIRLGGYLYWTRLRLGKRDTRYESLGRDAKMRASIYFLMHYLIQACFQAAVGFVFILTAQNTAFDSVWTKVGVAFWCVGYIGSIATDAQLHRFRIRPENKGKVCEVGLWNYSRHPNYFFEILVWCGFALIALPTRLGWLGLISPITLSFTMRFITGPISERQSLISKPEAYRRYRKTTSMIMPWFKKKSPGSAICDS